MQIVLPHDFSDLFPDFFQAVLAKKVNEFLFSIRCGHPSLCGPSCACLARAHEQVALSATHSLNRRVNTVNVRLFSVWMQ